MGWNLHAYYDIKQDEIDALIKAHNFNKHDCSHEDKIAELYKESYLNTCPYNLYPIYYWNNQCHMHEMYEIYDTNFIRDDERFTNIRYHKEFEKQTGEPFPESLKRINWTLRTRDDALKVASDINNFFSEDKALSHFARWLKYTAQYCDTYDLSL